MRKLLSAILVLLLALTAIVITAQDEAPAQTVGQLAIATEDLSRVSSALVNTELLPTLNGTGPFTLFAPNDAAFDALLDSLGISFRELSQQPELLTAILQYHVHPGIAYSGGLRTLEAPSMLMADGNSLPVRTTAAGELFVGEAEVVTADLLASNGVIHVIDRVLLPPGAEEDLSAAIEQAQAEATAAAEEATAAAEEAAAAEAEAAAAAEEEARAANGTVANVTRGNPQINTVGSALVATDLFQVLNVDGPYTLFAPTNEAFDAALAEFDLSFRELSQYPDVLSSILLYHVVEGEVTSDALESGEVETLGGTAVTINVDGDTVTVNDAAVVEADILATNGVVHIIDTVLLPPNAAEDLSAAIEQAEAEATAAAEEAAAAEAEAAAAAEEEARAANGTVANVTRGNPQINTVGSALVATDLFQVLNVEGPFTLFAPTNEAFDAALAEFDLSFRELSQYPDVLSSILLYHVVEGEITSDMLESGDVEMINGIPVVVNVDGDAVTVNDATVVEADILATNGVVHIIDTVLLPPNAADALSEAMEQAQAEETEEADTEETDSEEAGAEETEAASEEDAAAALEEERAANGTSGQYIVASEELNTLASALVNSETLPALNGEGPYTVFAPSDEAFSALLDDLGLSFRELSSDNELVTSVLLYHVVEGEYTSDALAELLANSDVSSLPTLGDVGVLLTKDDEGNVLINGASVVTADIPTTNGVVHIIDTVLLPPMN